MLDQETELLTPIVNCIYLKLPRCRLFLLKSEIFSFSITSLLAFYLTNLCLFFRFQFSHPSSKKTSLILEDGLHSALIFCLISI